jgi:hypothetical protein
MNPTIRRTFVLLLGQVCITCYAVCQPSPVSMREIELLIEEWNIVHNGRDVKGLEEVYDSTLLFYTHQVKREDAIRQKQLTFDADRRFRQRIASDIRFTGFTKGIVKCDFIREVREGSRWRPYESYLLVRIDSAGNRIVGESDYLTDKTLGFDLDEALAQKRLFAQPDSLQTVVPEAVSGVSWTKMLSDQFTFPDIFSPGRTVTIPVGYVVMLIAFIVAGGLIIFLTNSVRGRKHRVKTTTNYYDAGNAETLTDDKTKPNGKHHRNGNARASFNDHLKISTNRERQITFESFVMTLFDPMYFSYKVLKARAAAMAIVVNDEQEHLLEIQFRNKAGEARTFFVQCLFLNDILVERHVRLFSAERLSLNRQAAADAQVDLYYVVGMGGEPDHPTELYIIPGDLLKHETVLKDALKPFRKLGMFFYNSSTGKLQ